MSGRASIFEEENIGEEIRGLFLEYNFCSFLIIMLIIIYLHLLKFGCRRWFRSHIVEDSDDIFMFS